MESAESSAKEIIIVIEEIGEWVFTTKEILEYFICTLHIEMSLVEATAHSTVAATSAAYSSLLNVVSTIIIIVLSFLWIT